MENKDSEGIVKNLLHSEIIRKGPAYFNISNEVLSLFNEAAPKLAEMTVHFQKVKSEFQIRLFVETLNSLNITVSDFFEFLKSNENIKLPLTEFEELKKDSMFQIIKSIQESSLLTLEQKSAELKKLWLIIDESDAIKRKRDFVNMAQNYGIKTASLSTIMVVFTVCSNKLITSVKSNPNIILKEKNKIERAKLLSDSVRFLLKK